MYQENKDYSRVGLHKEQRLLNKYKICPNCFRKTYEDVRVCQFCGSLLDQVWQDE